MADMEFDVARARTTTKNIDQRAKQLQQEMKKVKSSIESVASWWKGDSGNKFKAQYSKIEADVNKLIKSVENISAEVKAAADAKEKEVMKV